MKKATNRKLLQAIKQGDRQAVQNLTNPTEQAPKIVFLHRKAGSENLYNADDTLYENPKDGSHLPVILVASPLMKLASSEDEIQL
ncbi:hypothetical protein Q0590_08440 [Rhodocytophaga aerolata]|uniref:Uncharacterized protein n=1 Tax=Rhodocytophaga aerolata TaxID=455078 RepID=A0ABT8R697_9BACT|nr:hypothetical protein [Rhodocytophaga aerolata]MDO1446277.1 hypothetical protein [Rhodocytophaga aerolata]